MSLPWTGWREYARVVSTQIVTENAVYKKDHVSDEAAGQAQLEVEVVHEVLMIERTGRLNRLKFDVPEALDENDETGGGFELNGSQYKNDDYPEGAGPSTVPTELSVRINSSLPDVWREKAEDMIELAGGYPPPTIPDP